MQFLEPSEERQREEGKTQREIVRSIGGRVVGAVAILSYLAHTLVRKFPLAAVRPLPARPLVCLYRSLSNLSVYFLEIPAMALRPVGRAESRLGGW